MDFLIGLILAVALLLFLIAIGTYQDLANRSGIPASNRRELVVPPIVYAVAILSAFLPISLLAIYPLLQIETSQSLILVIPACVAAFCALVAIGALALWLVHSRRESFGKCLTLSARLMLVPVIDAFWSSVAAFIAVVYASSALLFSFLINGYLIMKQENWLSAVRYIFSADFGLPIIFVFLALGLTIAYFIWKHGPSEVISKYYLIVGYAVLGLCVALAAYLYFSLGNLLMLASLSLIVVGLIFCAIYKGISSLYHDLGIAGVFGLELTAFSVILLFLTYASNSIMDVPIIGEIVSILIPSFVWAIAYEIGVLGLVSGLIVLAVARRQPEKGQLMTRAMAIAIGGSAFLPLLAWLGFSSPFGIVGSVVGILLVFVLVMPIYAFSLNILRVIGAMRNLIKPPVFGKRCFNCGQLNNSKAKFCGKCGQQL